MSDNWDFYVTRESNALASIFLDLDLVKTAPRRAFPHFRYVRVKMQNPTPEGLSSDEDFESLRTLQEHLDTALCGDGNALYVSRMTTGGSRDFYFYTKNANEFEETAQAAMKKFAGYEFETGGREDQEWEIYRELLYPDPFNLQVIRNRQTCDKLEQIGDDLSKPREIDHFLYFDTREDAEDFSKYAQRLGYAVHPIIEPDEQTTQFGIQMNRIDKPSEIDDIFAKFFDEAIRRRGTYDGWGCVSGVKWPPA